MKSVGIVMMLTGVGALISSWFVGADPHPLAVSGDDPAAYARDLESLHGPNANPDGTLGAEQQEAMERIQARVRASEAAGVRNVWVERLLRYGGLVIAFCGIGIFLSTSNPKRTK